MSVETTNSEPKKAKLPISEAYALIAEYLLLKNITDLNKREQITIEHINDEWTVIINPFNEKMVYNIANSWTNMQLDPYNIHIYRLYNDQPFLVGMITPFSGSFIPENENYLCDLLIAEIKKLKEAQPAPIEPTPAV